MSKISMIFCESVDVSSFPQNHLRSYAGLLLIISFFSVMISLVQYREKEEPKLMLFSFVHSHSLLNFFSQTLICCFRKGWILLLDYFSCFKSQNFLFISFFLLLTSNSLFQLHKLWLFIQFEYFLALNFLYKLQSIALVLNIELK